MNYSFLTGCVNFLIIFDLVLAQTVLPLPNNGDDSDTPTSSNEIQLGNFTEFRHQLHSGPIVIVNKNTFFVPNLHYDGKGPDAHFWVGNGTAPNENGLLVPDENGSREALKPYSGQNVYITLPENVTTDSIEYFGIWCIAYKQNFGHVTIPKDIPTSSNGIQLGNFTEFRHQLHSGPIVIVNKNTFFVPNLHYDGKGPDAHFWVGNGTAPDENGLLVLDENGSREALKPYSGQNVYITLPENVTTDSIEYFGLWCIAFKQNFGHVTIPKGIVVPPISPDFRMTANNEYIIRVQKCCSINESMNHNFTCVMQNQKFDPQINFLSKIDVQIERNRTSDIVVPFTNNIVCTEKDKSLRTVDGISLYLNGTIEKNQSVWNQDQYCIETYNPNNETNPSWKTVTVVCDNQNSPSSVPKIASISVNFRFTFSNFFSTIF